MKRRTVRCLLSLGAVLVCGSMAVAGPIPTPSPFFGPTGTLGDPCPAGVTGNPVAAVCGIGESDLASASSGTIMLNVDWMVLSPGKVPAAWFAPGTAVTGIDVNGKATAAPKGEYLYLFQAENTNVAGKIVAPAKTPPGNSMRELTIGVPKDSVSVAGTLLTPIGCDPTINPIYAVKGVALPGSCTGDDLDLANIYHPAHVLGIPIVADSAKEPNTTNEEEGICPDGDFAGDTGTGVKTGAGSGFCINPPDGIKTDFVATSVAWNFDPLKPPHHETITLFFFSPRAPVYGGANLIDFSPPFGASPWATGTTNSAGFTGDPVPIPASAIPEPTTLVLFGVGLLGLGVLRRKMKR